MTRTPPEVGDELFAALREHFDERQLVELTNVIALENLRSRFNSALRDGRPPGFCEGMVCIVPGVAPPSGASTRGVRVFLAGRHRRDRPAAAAAAARSRATRSRR